MTFDRIKEITSGHGGEHMGDLIWWALFDARVERQRLISLWEGAGFDTKLLPDETTAEKALKLAAREAQVGLKGALIRPLGDDKDEVSFSVVSEERGATENHYTTEARIKVAKQGATTLVTDAPEHLIVKLVQEKYNVNLATHSADDVRRSIVSLIHSLAAVSVRESGGIYWIPPACAERVRRLQGLIGQIGGSKAYVLPIHYSPEGQQALADVARASIETELQQLQKEVEEFLASPPARMKTLSSRLDSYAALKQKAGLYKTVLSAEVEGLDENLRKMARAIEEMLKAKEQAAKEAA